MIGGPEIVAVLGIIVLIFVIYHVIRFIGRTLKK